MTRVLVAPNAFKGSVSAVDAARDWSDRLATQGYDVDCCPIADGGDGTLEVLAAAIGGESFREHVTGPLGECVEAEWLLLSDGRAFVESAEACGMRRLPPGRSAGLMATSRGVGELLVHAGEASGHAVVGVGGTASTDGGMGALDALGVDPAHGPHGPVGAMRVEVACDVRNPMLGRLGSARVYGPQKGLGPDDVIEAERILGGWARAWPGGESAAEETGSGAGGGLAFGLHMGLGAALLPGADLVGDVLGLVDRVREADVVLTGEGRFDEQSAFGKATGELLDLARREGCRTVVVAGSFGGGSMAADVTHVALTEVGGRLTVNEAIDMGAELVGTAVEDLGRILDDV